ncbi:PQQ-like beta-propeller repeat protein [candidate division WOR-3 bacterium]|nr:PQQ-like beta-propeller repeat protein [candidate division WOR-3 bacterium]
MKRIALPLFLTFALLNAKEDSEATTLVLWTYEAEAGGNFSTAPVIAPDGTLYIGSYDGYLYAISLEGKFKWKYTPSGDLADTRTLLPSIGADGNVHVTIDPCIYTFSPEGKLLWRWEYETSDYWYTYPATDAQGNVYVGGGNYYYSLTPEGKLRWKYNADATVSAATAGPDGTLYFGSHDGFLYALTSDGELKWRYETEDTIRTFLQITPEGILYFGSDDGYLYALSTEGELKWRYQTGGKVWSTPAVDSDGAIYFGSWDDYLYALTPQGKLKWRYQTGDAIQSNPAIAPDGNIYFGSWDDYLYALTPKGKLKWRYKASAGISYDPILYDSTVYFVSDTLLYSINVTTLDSVASTIETEPVAEIISAPVVSGGAGLARVLDSRTPKRNTWTTGLSFAGDRHGADHMNDWTITTWENAVFRAFSSWVPFDKLEVIAAAGMGYTYLADTGDLEPVVGLWDAEIGAKYEFFRNPLASLGTDARVFIPLRSISFGGPRLGGSVKMLASITSSEIEGLSAYANLGGEYLETTALTWGIGLDYRYRILNPYVEFTGEISPDVTPVRVTPGLRFVTGFGLSIFYAADFGINLAARTVDLRGRDYVDQVSAGIALTF